MPSYQINGKSLKREGRTTRRLFWSRAHTSTKLHSTETSSNHNGIDSIYAYARRTACWYSAIRYRTTIRRRDARFSPRFRLTKTADGLSSIPVQKPRLSMFGCLATNDWSPPTLVLLDSE